MNTRKVKNRMMQLSVLLALTVAAAAVQAQTFIPATAYEYTYPSGTPAGDIPTCHSHGNLWFGVGSYDGYLSAVNGELIWQMTDPGNPWTIFNQGTISYPGCIDMNVGITHDGSNNLAVVAYYKIGAGHFYDVYKWHSGGLSLMSTTALSSLGGHTRINMDSHKLYGIVIVWQDASDIYCVTGLNGTFTSPILLGGTTNMMRPDVAFSHSSVGLMVHFVYIDPLSGSASDIYETDADFFNLHTSGGFYTPTVFDVNPVAASAKRLTPSIDCPDHYTVENWAYTYSDNAADIYVRSVDFNTTGVPVTTNVVDGTLGNVPMWAKELRPRIAYNQSCTSFHVAYYSSYSVGSDGACYFSEEILEDASALLSSPDYELVAANSNFPTGASLNSIAFSKQNDASPYLYTVFLDAGGVYHKFHKWNNIWSFKNGVDPQVQALKDNCSHDHEMPVSGKTSVMPQLAVGPNPFTEDFRLFVPAALAGETISLTLTDISGRTVMTYNGIASGAQPAIHDAVSSMNLSAGSYFLNAQMEHAGIQQNFKLNKINR